MRGHRLIHRQTPATQGLVSLLAILGSLYAAPHALAQAGGAPPTPVTVAPVVERDVPPALKLVGIVRAEKSAVIAAETEGAVAVFDAEEGQFLAPGAVICRLDPAVAELRVAEAQAALKSLQAQLEELENGERPEEIARLEALVAEAAADQQRWNYEQQRVADLFAKGQSNEKEKHDTDMEAAAAGQRLAQARAQLDRAKNGARAEEFARARMAVAAGEAVLRRLQRDLDKTQIRAPFKGVLVAKRTEVGEWVKQGDPAAELVAMETVKVRVDVPESAVRYAQAGQPTTVEIEALGTTRSANISRVIPRADSAAHTFPVEIDLANAEHNLLPGMFVWAYVPAGPAGKRLMVPKDAIVARGTAKTIFVVRAGEGAVPPAGAGSANPAAAPPMAIPLPVTTGLEIGNDIEVVAPGLQAGDLVVVRANERLYGPGPVIPTPLTPRAGTTPAAPAPQADPAATSDGAATTASPNPPGTD